MKRYIKTRNVETPKQIAIAIDESSERNNVVYCNDDYWLNWKSFLETFYTIPSDFKITKYHVFIFTKDDPANVQVKELSTDVTWQRFRLLKRTVSPSDVLTEQLLTSLIPNINLISRT